MTSAHDIAQSFFQLAEWVQEQGMPGEVLRHILDTAGQWKDIAEWEEEELANNDVQDQEELRKYG